MHCLRPYLMSESVSHVNVFSFVGKCFFISNLRKCMLYGVSPIRVRALFTWNDFQWPSNGKIAVVTWAYVLSVFISVQQSSFYGYTSMLPPRYTQAVMTGESTSLLLIASSLLLIVSVNTCCQALLTVTRLYCLKSTCQNSLKWIVKLKLWSFRLFCVSFCFASVLVKCWNFKLYLT